MVIICMGVSGSGKTTIGRALAKRLHLPFFDADDYHPPQNLAKMKRGEALSDQDRRPWLNDLARHVDRWSRAGGAVLACSALKASYRRVLRASAPDDVRFVYLQGDPQTVEARLRARPDHFFPVQLLHSQYDALEEPEDAIVMDAREAPDAIVETLVRRLPPSAAGDR